MHDKKLFIAKLTMNNNEIDRNLAENLAKEFI